MRTLLAVLLGIGLAAVPLRAQQFRIATWQVADVVMQKLTNAAPAVEPPRIAEIANTLSTAEADAIILYGITDGQVLKRIAEGMKPKRYSVTIHSVFRQGNNRGPVVGLPFGILARREKMAAKNIEWNVTGRIDMPGGFTFATLNHGSGAVCIYVANMPGSLTNGVGTADGSYFSRKRNYAAEFLAHHTAWIATTYTNQPFATYLTGDINLVSRKPVKDDCAPLLEKAGFRPVPVGVAQDKSTLAITNGPLVSRVFDPVFTRNVDFMATRQVAVPAPDQPMVICEITLKPSGSASVTKPVRLLAPKPKSKPEPIEDLPPVAPVPAPAPVQVAATPPPVPVAPPAASLLPTPAPAPVQMKTNAPATDAVASRSSSGSLPIEPWFWPVVAGGALGLMAVIVLNARSARRRNTSTALGRPMFVEMNSSPRSSRTMAESARDAVLSEPTTATDNAHNGLWQTPSVRLGTSQPESSKDARAGLVPHLRQLMREKLFQWLSNQRSQLIDSHEAGTAKVLGLEERLGKIRDQFQDRMIAQEQRIAEMDRELQEKEKLLNESRKPKPESGDPTQFT
jgi:hypothetical protein